MSVEKDGKESVQSREYYVSRYMGSGLPRSENRELPATAEAQRASAQAETVLAFPATQDNCPILEPQSVFAFLPIRKTTFKVSDGRELQAEQQLTCHSFSFNPTSTPMQVDRTSL